ncbi:DUF6125 family protein [Carboxydothermus hydrogenoformans]|uniref:Cytosolic protein n=1 Tax=Carboxydothermus hydrogenoformans (strain ATCC BAA-161 / DSM 6008 / Z-2901) TaxID=246194 RepID=Q3ACK5_CARHZ|nr:DUF6125 family protein [Carboxydothermus hydrogenoformans]ABB15955.1 hypothetical protein CHY_1295 [Carboxydothermus hydrogenoformans Z-2901]
MNPQDLTKEQILKLLEDFAKRWLAHDGLWFLEVEKNFGLEKAIELDEAAWAQFTVLEAKRIKKFLNLPENGGLEALKTALRFRLYGFLNQQELSMEGNKLIYKMKTCRVQEARKRKNLPDFPCKLVGITEYSGFAKTIDPRIKTRCLACPPDEHPDDFYCAWEFWVEE